MATGKTKRRPGETQAKPLTAAQYRRLCSLVGGIKFWNSVVLIEYSLC